ncbi:hypothetical protein [Nocardia sp. NPDC020380]|uniref:hypothetical protein n=1 Tax=Nocardia sp. NPDC020380 TaxID=3364309 RepID=UPI0037AAF05B
MDSAETRLAASALAAVELLCRMTERHAGRRPPTAAEAAGTIVAGLSISRLAEARKDLRVHFDLNPDDIDLDFHPATATVPPVPPAQPPDPFEPPTPPEPDPAPRPPAPMPPLPPVPEPGGPIPPPPPDDPPSPLPDPRWQALGAARPEAISR